MGSLLFLSLYVRVCMLRRVRSGSLSWLSCLLLSYFYTHTENKGGDAHSQSGTKARIFLFPSKEG